MSLKRALQEDTASEPLEIITTLERPLFPSLDTTIVTVHVGKDAHPFHVHRAPLCEWSEYFKGAFLGHFIEAEEKAMYLDDVTVEIFVAFTEWLYVRAVIPQPVVTYSSTERQRRHDWFEGGWGDDESNARDALEGPEEDYGNCHSDLVDSFTENLLSLYIFADKYAIPELRTDLLDTLIQWCSYADITPDIQCVPRAFKYLPSSSPFCRYLTDINAAFWFPEDDGKSSLHPSLPQKFLLEIISINSYHGMDGCTTINHISPGSVILWVLAGITSTNQKRNVAPATETT
ncbi:hypothetical protein W97_05196 [Coniosporium apollinis CBS 100218]|uniref:BTB domain-containing protein n=1 Tax=Coniosporium apollinis (strain CBS 100218) TaxID=1168221 RepID=R7YVW4_CONA1|nr:uncharacterized protein W97_05196 [Coniosporium apollinis CBS 100218]EON65954.1 hypothetical protein W97_05196 [Coniosporium apollinis CBS 100218]